MCKMGNQIKFTSADCGKGDINTHISPLFFFLHYHQARARARYIVSETTGKTLIALKILLHCLRDLILQHLKFNSSLWCCGGQVFLASDFQLSSHYRGEKKPLSWFERKREENRKVLLWIQGRGNWEQEEERGPRQSCLRASQTFIDLTNWLLWSHWLCLPSMSHQELPQLVLTYAPLLPLPAPWCLVP